MRKPVVLALGAAAVAVVAGAAVSLLHLRPQPITVDYPLAGAWFPLFPPPLVEWHVASPAARAWTIEVAFGSSAAPALHASSDGEPAQIGEIDPRAVGPTNELRARLSMYEGAAHRPS